MDEIVSLILVVLCQFTGIVSGEWPDGRYGLPMPRTGCPSGAGWETGVHQHETEMGSFVSEGNHLSDGETQHSRYVVQHFCIKTVYSNQSNQKQSYEFLPGRYCLLKKQVCPPKFQSGWIYWDDAAALFRNTIQYSNGTLPDGSFDRNTKISYCCRADGYADVSIELPTDKPFYLYKHGDQCQKVKGMNVEEEWVHWAGEKSLNRDEQWGQYPTIERRNEPFNIYTRLFYCYYTRRLSGDPPSNSLETFLFVVYFVCTLFGFALVVAIILATIQRLLGYRQERHIRRQMALERETRPPGRSSNTARLINEVSHVPRSVCSSSEIVANLPSEVSRSASEETRTNERNKIIEAMSPPAYDELAGAVGGAPAYNSWSDDLPHSSTAILLDSDELPPPAYDDVFGETPDDDESSLGIGNQRRG